MILLTVEFQPSGVYKWTNPGPLHILPSKAYLFGNGWAIWSMASGVCKEASDHSGSDRPLLQATSSPRPRACGRSRWVHPREGSLSSPSLFPNGRDFVHVVLTAWCKIHKQGGEGDGWLSLNNGTVTSNLREFVGKEIFHVSSCDRVFPRSPDEDHRLGTVRLARPHAEAESMHLYR